MANIGILEILYGIVALLVNWLLPGHNGSALGMILYLGMSALNWGIVIYCLAVLFADHTQVAVCATFPAMWLLSVIADVVFYKVQVVDQVLLYGFPTFAILLGLLMISIAGRKKRVLARGVRW